MNPAFYRPDPERTELILEEIARLVRPLGEHDAHVLDCLRLHEEDGGQGLTAEGLAAALLIEKIILYPMLLGLEEFELLEQVVLRDSGLMGWRLGVKGRLVFEDAPGIAPPGKRLRPSALS